MAVRIRWMVLAGACLLGAAAVGTRAAPPGQSPPAQLVERARRETPVIADLRELCERIGPRPTGSEQCERAVAWGAQKFREAGADSVSLESFTIPNLWLPARAEAACTQPAPFALHLAAAPYSESTPTTAPLEARLVDAGDGSAAAFSRLGARARGAIALVKSEPMESMVELVAEHMRDPALLRAARKAQVAALLIQSTHAGNSVYRHLISLDGSIVPLPVAIVGRDDADHLSRVAAQGEVRLRLTLANRIGPAYESKNVVAEIRGREKPDEVVLLGAHLDSWDLGTGAQDNGVNAAMVIDVARGMKALRLTPRRTIRFVLFTGEEQGLWGSAGYVQRHHDEVARHVAAIVYDAGSGRTTGFYLNGREELRRPVEAALAAVPDLGASRHSPLAFEGTDNFAFILAGIPNLVADQDPTPYLPVYHAESDTLERVDSEGARQNIAVAAALTWGLAESASRPAPTQTAQQVRALLRETRLDRELKAVGLQGTVPNRKPRRNR